MIEIKQNFWLYDNPDTEAMNVEELQSAIRSNSFCERNQGFTPADKKALRGYITHRIIFGLIPTIVTVGIASIVMKQIQEQLVNTMNKENKKEKVF